MGFGSAFHLAWLLYETILSAVHLEGGEHMERTQHQFDFPPGTWSTTSNYCNSVSLVHLLLLEWLSDKEEFLFFSPNSIWPKGLYLNNGSLSSVFSASWCSSGCFFIVKLITQFLNAEPSQQAAEWLARWLGCYLGVPELATPLSSRFSNYCHFPLTCVSIDSYQYHKEPFLDLTLRNNDGKNMRE